MTEAVVVSACRTAIGTSGKGTLVNTSAWELGHAIVEASLKRSGLSGDDIDDIILGEGMYGGGVIARHAALTNGMPTVPGMALNRHCATSLSTVSMGAALIRGGVEQAVIAGGVESRSTAPHSKWRNPATGDWAEPWMPPTHPNRADAPNADMSITVGWNLAKIAGITREEMDAWALHSHEKAVRAIEEGRFLDEIIPVQALAADGSRVTFQVDEHPRANTSPERLAALKPLHPEIPGFSITAGNASGINDGAAALTLTSDSLAAQRGMTPLAVVRSWAAVAVDPYETGIAPARAIPKALRRAGLSVGDVTLFEINEAFASVPVACVRELDIDPGIVNPNGSGCSLGHPVSASGARMLTTLVHETRRRGGGIAVAAMCAGGGMGAAVVLEVAAPSTTA